MQIETRETPSRVGPAFPVTAFVVLLLDQLSKQWFWHNARNYDIIDGYFHITLVRNAGAAFGMMQGARVFFVVASVIAAGFLLYVGLRTPREERYRRVLLGAILGGAVGNLIDRVYAGEVIDFLQIGVAGHYWPVFNVADMGVSVGATLLLLHILRQKRDEGTAAGDPAGVPIDPHQQSPVE